MIKIFLVCLLVILSVTPVYALKEVRSIQTRDGVTLSFLLRDKAETIGKTVVILFPGSDGAHPFRLEENGKVRGNNFLVRTSKDFAQEFTAVIVDAPSDHQSGMDDDFRKSSEHAEDIEKLITYLTLQGAERFFLIGTSRGTLSVASLAAKIQNPLVRGCVLTSSLEYAKFMRWVALDTIKKPLMLVHHTDDACKICSFDEAIRTRDVLLKTTTVDFIAVTGGDAPKSGPCEALSAHGFLGVEEKAVKPIMEWIRKH